MSDRFTHEELHRALTTLTTCNIERLLEERFGAAFVPFDPHIHRLASDDLKLSSVQSTPLSIDCVKTHAPSVEPENDLIPYQGEKANNGEANVTIANVREIANLASGRERYLEWSGLKLARHATSDKALPATPMAAYHQYSNSVDELEVPTEKATSYSGSDAGDVVHTSDVSQAIEPQAIEPQVIAPRAAPRCTTRSVIARLDFYDITDERKNASDSEGVVQKKRNLTGSFNNHETRERDTSQKNTGPHIYPFGCRNVKRSRDELSEESHDMIPKRRRSARIAAMFAKRHEDEH